MMHFGCLAAIWVGWSPVAVSVAAALYFIRMFAITGIYHRYFSHRAYKTSRFTQFLFALLGASATQRGPLWWAAHHRHHHRHSDDEEDVHSPHTHGLYWSHMGWITSKRCYATDYSAVRDLAQFPELVFLNRFDTLVPAILAASMFGLGVGLNAIWPTLGTSGTQMFVWGFLISTVVLFHGTCTINSLAHMIGRRRYETTDKSKNSFMLALITLGEGWHNNHHHHPGAVRQGFFWWEIDISFYILKMLSWVGIVWDLNGVPEAIRNPAKAVTKTASAVRETSDDEALCPIAGSLVGTSA
jgi:stearoyl-CoA desaturase (delta-9 desaturase)